jgi:hypothetical protein
VDEFPEWSVSGVLGRAGIGARWTDCPDLSPLYFVSLSPSNMSLPEYTRRCWAIAIFDLAATISFRSNTVHAGSTAVRANEGPPTTMTVRSIAALQRCGSQLLHRDVIENKTSRSQIRCWACAASVRGMEQGTSMGGGRSELPSLIRMDQRKDGISCLG